jgi:hypothetical protein
MYRREDMDERMKEINEKLIHIKTAIALALDAEFDDLPPGVLVSALGSLACDIMKHTDDPQFIAEHFIKTVRNDMKEFM